MVIHISSAESSTSDDYVAFRASIFGALQSLILSLTRSWDFLTISVKKDYDSLQKKMHYHTENHNFKHNCLNQWKDWM